MPYFIWFWWDIFANWGELVYLETEVILLTEFTLYIKLEQC